MAGHGLHPSLVKGTGEPKQCNVCHAEHQGEDFVPIRWDVDLSEFDHARTSYALEGAHRGLECRKCHTPKHISEAERRKITMRDAARTYLGLSRECLSCHVDAHRGQLPADCLKCHTFSKWKPASKFDHAQTKYSLLGAHEKLACEKCHRKDEGPTPYIKFAGLSFTSCDACHKDPHKSAFSITCKSCHSEGGWKPTRLATEFDHGKTEFQLAGKHATVACMKCHRTNNFKEPVAHARCMDCHKTGLHGGQFAGRADRGECSACHVVDGWKPSKFDVAAHVGTHYALGGRHAEAPCAKCHLPAGQATVYRVKFGKCVDCHEDRHKGQFAGPAHANRCDDCHTVKGFQHSTFTLANHARTRMPLSGAHIAVVCGECHFDAKNGRAQPGRFRFPDVSCAGCHSDPHQGQFRDRMLAVQSNGGAAGCETCHSLRTWRDVTKFDHSTSSFPLAGTHRGVPCEKCHPPSGPSAGVKTVVFRSTPSQCAGCHEDVHGGQFSAGTGRVDCSRCHGTLQWRPALFAHDTQTRFALTGVHRRTGCRQCHKTERQIGGKSVVMYKPAPRECEGCHGPEVKG